MKFLPETQHEYEFQMVSFVDVIFVLLAFFVLGSSFKMPEKDFGMGCVQVGTAAGAKAEDFPKNIAIELRKRGEGVAISVGQAKLPDNDFGAIRQKLAEINMPELGVLVMSEPELSVDQLAHALDAILASPMKKVSVAPLPPGRPARAVAQAMAVER